LTGAEFQAIYAGVMHVTYADLAAAVCAHHQAEAAFRSVQQVQAAIAAL